MKITKSQLKQIIKEELGRVMEQEESLKVPEGSAGQQFIDAVLKIQGVLKKYNLGESTLGTYDPMDLGDSGAAWNRYTKQWNRVHADPAFKEAEKSLLGLIVNLKYDKTPLRIEDVSVPYGGFEASDDMVIDLVDPRRPTYKNGNSRVVNTLSFDAHSFHYDFDEVESIENPQEHHDENHKSTT